MAGNDVVGRDTTKPVAQTGISPETIALTKAKVAKLSGMTSAIDTKLGLGNIVIDDVKVADINFIDTLTDSQLTSIALLLKKRGVSLSKSKADVKRFLLQDETMVNLIGAAGENYGNLIKNMQQDYMPGLEKPDAAVLPSRSIYQYSEEDVKSTINESYQAALGRNATDVELDARLEKVRASLTTGTLSTTKKVKNPKTGVLENVTTQTPGASKTDVQATLQGQLEQLHPEEADRTARIDFSSWLSKNVQGA